MRWRRPLTTAAALVTGLLTVAAAVLTALAPTPAALGNLAVLLAAGPACAVLGVVVLRRQPGNAVGLCLGLVGLATAVTATKEIGWQVLAGYPERWGDWAWAVAVLNESAWWVFTAVGLLLLYFPDGRLPGPRWRWVPPVMVACTGAEQVNGAVEAEPYRPPFAGLAHPFGPPPAWLDAVTTVTFVLMLALTLACAVSLTGRYRRGDRVRRAQVKWLALAGLGVPAYPLLCLAEILLWGQASWFSGAVGIAALIGMPVAVGIAVLRHDLYDVDKAIATAVTWVLVTVVLVVVFVASASAAGLVLGRDSPAAAAGATAVAALALAPLRARLQRRVDRRLYPLRASSRTAVETLHRRASSGEARPEELQAVLRVALRDPGLRVGFRLPGTEGFVDAEGSPVETVEAAGGVPVTLGGGPIGVLVPDDGVASPELLRQVAADAGTIVEVVRLRLEVAKALRDVESSRARLVQTGYEERRRLERDLHDGAQQRLVSLGMALRLAQRHLADGTVDVDALLDQSVAELGTAVAELRQIARGLRPSGLDDGLPGALAALLRTVPVVVDLEVCPDPLPDDVATTAYYVVSEAVANAVKHAEASCITLRVARSGGHVVVSVRDDGRGGAELRPQSGLADRVAALGGRLRVDSPAGRGTVVEAALPCAS
jgi:signal transduction histidine kinase